MNPIRKILAGWNDIGQDAKYWVEIVSPQNKDSFHILLGSLGTWKAPERYGVPPWSEAVMLSMMYTKIVWARTSSGYRVSPPL